MRAIWVMQHRGCLSGIGYEVLGLRVEGIWTVTNPMQNVGHAHLSQLLTATHSLSFLKVKGSGFGSQ
jgi:hypothetical protein